MTGDRLIRAATAVTVLLVAAIAAIVSYQHLYHLAITHGETRLDAALLPLSIDGTVVTGSLLMLRAARLGLGTPWLARVMMAVAVIMTIAANVAFGWAAGAWGILMAGWPAAAFLMNAEGSISFGRKTRAAPGPGTPVPEPPAGLNGHAEAAADLFAADLAAGRVPGVRRIRREMHLGQPRAQEVRAYLAGLANGHGGSS
jgi:hypothetical protein